MARLPASADLSAASLSLSIPGDRRVGGAPLARLATSGERHQTILRMTLSDVLLRLVFEPALVIHLPPPLSNLALQNIAYELATGAITPSLFYAGSFGVHAGLDAAKDAARAWMRDLVTSTPLAIPPYDPAADPELLSTIRALLGNLQGAGASAAPPIAPSEIGGITASVRLSFPEDVEHASAAGGVRIPGGADASLTIELSGSLPEIEAAPRIRAIKIESSSVILQKDGVDQVSVKRFIVRPGGAIEVEQLTALGEAGVLAGAESLIRLLG